MKARALLYAGLVIGMASSANAATVVFYDNFDSTPIGVPTNSLPGWTIGGPGNIDVIGSGSGFDYLPGNGHYLDLLGSPGPATISTTMTFGPGDYRVEFKLAGNQNGGVPSRNEPSKTTEVKIGSTILATLNPGTNDPFTTYVYYFTLATLGNQLSFASFAQPNVNIGNLLDEVTVSTTPLPAALPLFAAGLGLIGAAVARRRKRKDAASLATA
jgi:hypothetical protein